MFLVKKEPVSWRLRSVDLETASRVEEGPLRLVGSEPIVVAVRARGTAAREPVETDSDVERRSAGRLTDRGVPAVFYPASDRTTVAALLNVAGDRRAVHPLRDLERETDPGTLVEPELLVDRRVELRAVLEAVVAPDRCDLHRPPQVGGEVQFRCRQVEVGLEGDPVAPPDLDLLPDHRGVVAVRLRIDAFDLDERVGLCGLRVRGLRLNHDLAPLPADGIVRRAVLVVAVHRAIDVIVDAVVAVPGLRRVARHDPGARLVVAVDRAVEIVVDPIVADLLRRWRIGHVVIVRGHRSQIHVFCARGNPEQGRREEESPKKGVVSVHLAPPHIPRRHAEGTNNTT